MPKKKGAGGNAEVEYDPKTGRYVSSKGSHSSERNKGHMKYLDWEKYAIDKKTGRLFPNPLKKLTPEERAERRRKQDEEAKARADRELELFMQDMEEYYGEDWDAVDQKTMKKALSSVIDRRVKSGDELEGEDYLQEVESEYDKLLNPKLSKYW